MVALFFYSQKKEEKKLIRTDGQKTKLIGSFASRLNSLKKRTFAFNISVIKFSQSYRKQIYILSYF
jgi:hypothetical protein